MANINTDLRTALQTLDIMPGPSGMEYEIDQIIDDVMEATSYRYDERAIVVTLRRFGIVR